jgi:phosphonopyruvate decarboxylase
MTMTPEDVVRVVAEMQGEGIVVPTMTTVPAWRLTAPDALAVSCVGFMGGASSMGLGLALAKPGRRVVVLDGDGSLLMQLGSLATVAGAAPKNYTHVVMANGVYQTSGSQGIPAEGRIDFEGLARAAGYAHAETIDNLEDFRIRWAELIRREGPVMVQLMTSEAELTPMTAPGGAAFAEQVATLREKLEGA